jgi:hypothetical protein
MPRVTGVDDFHSDAGGQAKAIPTKTRLNLCGFMSRLLKDSRRMKSQIKQQNISQQAFPGVLQVHPPSA